MNTSTILIGGLLATGLAVLLLPDPDTEQIVQALPSTAPRQVEQNPSEPSFTQRTQTAPDAKLTGESEISDLGVERNPDAIVVENNLFRAAPIAVLSKVPDALIITPPPEPPRAAPFVLVGLVNEGNGLRAIAQIGERVAFLAQDEVFAGFKIESIDERGVTLMHQASSTRLLVQAKVTR